MSTQPNPRHPVFGTDALRLRDQLRALRADAEAWPEGVIARYLTIANATVDLTHTTDPASEEASDWDETRAVCLGCGATEDERWNTRPYTQLITVVEAERIATAVVREWAQAHAEKCRALPRPEAGR